MSGSQLSPEQQAIEKLWEAHLASEFKTKSAEAAINTMVERPSVTSNTIWASSRRGSSNSQARSRTTPAARPSWRHRAWKK